MHDNSFAPKSFFMVPQMAGTLLLLPLILFLDSPALAARLGSQTAGQWIANGCTLAYFLWVWYSAKASLRAMMLIGLGVATAGEVFFSLVVGMYEYRLGNIPLYVPPGHTLVYATIYYWIRAPWVRRAGATVTLSLFVIGSLYSGYWLMAHNDVYGFLCFLTFAAILYFNRESAPFFVAMYLLVAYLELIGTGFGNWYWHPILLNRWPAIPSGNPPAGISVFYFGFDIGCLGFYLLTHLRIRARYDRQKAWRKTRLKKTHPNLLAPETEPAP